MNNIEFSSPKKINFVFNNKYNNMQCGIIPKNRLVEDTVEFSYKQNKKNIDYSIDDGKISFSDKIKNFAKGVISPITTLFSSPKTFAMGAGMIAGGAAIMLATGGGFAPVLIGLGIVGGTIQLGKSIYQASKATTDEEARNAWQGIGSGTSNIAFSVAGAKSSLKAAGIDTSKMSPLKATIECFRQIPSSIKHSVNAFTSGQAVANFKNAFNFKAKSNAKKIRAEEIKSEAEARISQENMIAENCRRNDKAIQEMQNPTSTSTELQAHPELQNKNGGYSAEASAKFFEENGLTDTEIKLNQKLEKFKAQIKDKTLHFDNEELAVKAFDELISAGYDTDDFIITYTADSNTIQRLETHALNISTISDKQNGKAINGFHVKEGYDKLFKIAQKNSGVENNARKLIDGYFVDKQTKGNFNNATITVSRNPNSDNSIVLDIKRMTDGLDDISLIITRESDDVVAFSHCCSNGTIETRGVKTIVDSEELKHVFALLKQKGVKACKGIYKGKVTNGFMFKYNGQYYFGPVSSKTNQVTSIFPITKKAATQRNFILDLIPVLDIKE